MYQKRGSNKERKKARSDSVRCSCCGKLRNILTQTPLTTVQEAFSNGWKCTEDWAVRYAKTGHIRWACNACLKAGKAIEGKPGEQTFVDHAPYLAYIDRPYICEDCHCPFIFSAKEQQYWYEKLKFWVQSYPKQCLECRRKRRAKKQAMQDIHIKES